MEYTEQNAEKYIGKRVIVSLREISSNQEENYTGFWGVINSAQKDGLLLSIEGGLDEKFWMIPPDLDSFKEAEFESYQLGENENMVIDVDYELYFTITDNLEDLKNRKN